MIDRLSFSLNAGDHTLINGANGAGKSTFLKVLTREIHPFRGEGKVVIGGHERMTQFEVRRFISSVSHDLEEKLIHDPTVRDLVASGAIGTLGILDFEKPSKEDWTQVDRIILHFGLPELQNRPISTLSSGERKRAWLARSMVFQPQVLVLDEPDAHLDSHGLQMLKEDLRRIASLGTTIVCASHRFTELFGPFKVHLRMDHGRFAASIKGKVLRSVPRGAEVQDYFAAMQNSPIYDVAEQTPTEYCRKLSSITGTNVWLKREDMQSVRSFKLRGAYHKISLLSDEEKKRGIITASAGNHAQGVALSAQRLGIEATIVVPTTTPELKREAIVSYGAQLIMEGDTYDEANLFALALGKERGLTYVHPFDDPDVIVGQGTIGLELFEQSPKLDAVFVAVGGGGLIAGIAIAIKSLSPTTKVIGVEPEDSDAMHRSLQAGKRVTLDRVGLLADGVAVRTVGEETFRIAQELVDEVIVVSNDAICGAIKEIFEDRRAILEPAGALAYAGLKIYAQRGQCSQANFAAIACGANVSFDRLRYVAERANVGERREAIFACQIPEVKGSFLRFCKAIGARQVTEFNYRMGNPLKASVFVGIGVQDDDERYQLKQKLESSGYETIDLTSDELTTTHLRHMVGGQSIHAEQERFYLFNFPERPGALLGFLQKLGGSWNISLFHYRNHGADRGRVLVSFEVDPATAERFDEFRKSVGYESEEVTGHPGLDLFLGKGFA